MRAAWSILVGILALNSVAQDFTPFTSNSHKLFANADRSATYSLSFDSVTTTGDTATYYNLREYNPIQVPSNCPWWGGPFCNRIDRPGWIGPATQVASNGHHVFQNLWNNDIHLSFSTDTQDTTVMYEDGTQRFLLSYDGQQQQSVLGQQVEVRQWTVHHRDLDGNAITSPLNGAAVRAGADIGLLSLFRVDSFPLVLEPLDLVGQSEPPLGLHRISRATIEDHQPGDEIQYHEMHSLPNGPPWENYDRYRKHIFLQRTDLPGAVQYLVREELFNTGSTDLVVDTITLNYSDETLFEIPFERFVGYRPMVHNGAFCGSDLWQLDLPPEPMIDIQATAYCEAENCWGPTDTNGPPPQGSWTDVIGLGRAYYHEYVISPFGYSLFTNIVYFRKNGTVCFDEVMMGSAEASVPQVTFQLSPNPSEGLVGISSGKPVAQAEVFDTRGNLMANINLDTRLGRLDMRSTPDGLYLVRLRFVDGGVGTQRLVIGR